MWECTIPFSLSCTPIFAQRGHVNWGLTQCRHSPADFVRRGDARTTWFPRPQNNLRSRRSKPGMWPLTHSVSAMTLGRNSSRTSHLRNLSTLPVPAALVNPASDINAHTSSFKCALHARVLQPTSTTLFFSHVNLRSQYIPALPSECHLFCNPQPRPATIARLQSHNHQLTPHDDSTVLHGPHLRVAYTGRTPHPNTNSANSSSSTTFHQHILPFGHAHPAPPYGSS